MQPSGVRDYVLKDHTRLRARLERIENEAAAVERGEMDRQQALLEEAEGLVGALLTHMKWEDVHLAQALCDADAWGPERVERLRREHCEQRELLFHVLEILRGPNREEPLLLARKITDFVALVREDMEEEERCALDPNVLRDDVIAIAVEAG